MSTAVVEAACCRHSLDCGQGPRNQPTRKQRQQHLTHRLLHSPQRAQRTQYCGTTAVAATTTFCRSVGGEVRVYGGEYSSGGSCLPSSLSRLRSSVNLAVVQQQQGHRPTRATHSLHQHIQSTRSVVSAVSLSGRCAYPRKVCLTPASVLCSGSDLSAKNKTGEKKVPHLFF